MNEYDLIVVCIDDANGVVELISNKVADLSGKILSKEAWGKRDLAYSINKLKSGNYDFFRFSLPSKSLSELNTYLKSDKNIIRYLILKSRTVIN